MSDVDALIHRHLEGALTEAEARALEERLRGDPEARRLLAEMAFDQAQLRELLVPADSGVAADAPAARWTSGSKTFLATAAALLLAVGTGLVVLFTRTAPAPPLAPATRPSEPAHHPAVSLDVEGMDADGDGRVTRDEWATAFKRFDTDGDGQVSAQELSAAGVAPPPPRPKRHDPR